MSKNTTPESFPFFNRSKVAAEKLAATAWKEWGYEKTPALQIVNLRGYIDMPFFFTKTNVNAIRAIGSRAIIGSCAHEKDDRKSYCIIECSTNKAAEQIVNKFKSGEKHTVVIGDKPYSRMTLLLSPEKEELGNAVEWLGVKEVNGMEHGFFRLMPTESFEALCNALTPDEDGVFGYRLF